MSLKSLVAKFILKGRVKNIMGKLMDKLSGKKTYVTAIIGVLIAGVGLLFGPFEAAGVDIPKIEFNTFFTILWEAALVVFLRKGISSSKK